MTGPVGPATDIRTSRTVNSALWASWADATGFISELTDARGLSRRLSDRPLTGPVAWQRRLGGRFGPTLELPAGTYSDDTQLRLATCRAIGLGSFDVDAFARVELPVWSAYALGGGRASKTAAQSMNRADAAWYANSYPGWLDSGGNGAVMRVQPHAWAAASPDRPGPWMADVFANAVCTHGHPRALLASALHCYALGRALMTGSVPGPDTWPQLLALAAGATELLHHRIELVEYWAPRYDHDARTAGHDGFAARWEQTVHEVQQQMRKLAPLASRMVTAGQQDRPVGDTGEPAGQVTAAYEEVVALLQLRDPDRRGSATGTALAALAVSWCLSDKPTTAVLLTCRATGTDTDTIATMVGALVGAAATGPPSPAQAGDGPGALQTADTEYQTVLARRCAALALDSDPGPAFTYPDLLAWSPPKTGLDAVMVHGDRRVLAGLGFIVPCAPATPGQRDQVWQWHQLDFGQHVLLKMRAEPAAVAAGQLPGHRPAPAGPGRAGEAIGVKDIASSTPARPSRDRHREEERRRNALAHLSDAQSRQEELPLNAASAAERECGAVTAAPTEARSAPSGDLEGLLKWVANNAYDDRSIAFLVRRLVATARREEYLVAMSLLADRLRAEGRV